MTIYICMHDIALCIRLESSGCPERFIIRGMDGPYTSESNRPTANPCMYLHSYIRLAYGTS